MNGHIPKLLPVKKSCALVIPCNQGDMTDGRFLCRPAGFREEGQRPGFNLATTHLMLSKWWLTCIYMLCFSFYSVLCKHDALTLLTIAKWKLITRKRARTLIDDWMWTWNAVLYKHRAAMLSQFFSESASYDNSQKQAEALRMTMPKHLWRAEWGWLLTAYWFIRI